MALTEQEEKILDSIIVASENDPDKPEFPPDDPKFPATPTYKIEVPGFSNVWLKDESHNKTGTHKDRMAWEMIVTYKEFLKSKKVRKIDKLPILSILSSGSAALAIQTQLKKYRLPSLHVLMDLQTDPSIVDNLKKAGCKIFLEDLGRKTFDWEEILRLTENEDGFDITSNEAYDPTVRFYDWLSYEIINSDTDYIFVPFGTGQLYENIMNIIKKELNYKINDPRFKGTMEVLQKTSVLGATTTNPKSKADKLYAPFLPFANYSKQWIKFYRFTGLTGEMSQVYNLEERYLDEAIKIASEQKIDFEPSGIAGLGLLLQIKDKIPKDKKILIVNTGKTKWS
ncbi:pyridoxal-phosphate dependent enzyme [Candidatus Uhrbacteria bacterium]|nr:pyridoxal-phosphate dependent enzyme [Candidatus Uhrbacteria bacterium]